MFSTAIEASVLFAFEISALAFRRANRIKNSNYN